jgi:FdhD protein
MRTPGDDLDLAAGFLFTEGILHDPADVDSMHHCPTDDAASAMNIINVNPVDPASVDPSRWQRNFFVTSSCGICGKASIDAVRQETCSIKSSLCVAAGVLYGLSAALRRAQSVFEQTGGLHAAALFTPTGEMMALREDVGRHNAVDKVIGHAFRSRLLPLSDYLLLVSGRASFEIVQKALMAGIPLVAAVSAPSSLAVDLAEGAGMTLVGFLRKRRFNVYSVPERVAL